MGAEDVWRGRVLGISLSGGSYYSHGERVICIELCLSLGGLCPTTSIENASKNTFADGSEQRRGTLRMGLMDMSGGTWGEGDHPFNLE